MNNEKNFDFNTYLINHAEELKRFSKDVNILSSSALTQLQRLPVSLRRRAASHNIKRLPHRFQKLAKNVVASKVVKRCRKYRRRHLNLREVYLKRQTKNKWLYTHIWHTKRFKMINKWGWRVPLEPAQKSFRPCMKAMKDGCCVVDTSYFCTLEVCGKLKKILNQIGQLVAKTSFDVLKKKIKEGKEINFVLYKPESWPYHAICPCKMMIISSDQPNNSSVMLAIHTSAREEVIAALCQVLSLTETIQSSVWMDESKSIVLRDRSWEFCRFRLLGHLSQNVLAGLLDTPEMAFLSSQRLTGVPRGFIVETTVDNLTTKRPLLKQTDIPLCPANNPATFPIRDLSSSKFRSSEGILTALKNGDLSQFNDLSKFDLDPVKNDDSSCPILMSRHHYLDGKAPGGWDMIVPAKWAMAMWTTLIMKGCRAIGLRYWTRFCALEATSLQSKHDCFPMFAWPDSNQGAIEAETARESQLSQWKRRPPAKRVNFAANATPHPFECPWSTLLPPNQPFYVMRDADLLFRVVVAIVDGRVRPSLAELDEFSPNARHALIPVILDCSATAVTSNATIMLAEPADDLSASLDAIRPIIGFAQIADQCLLSGRGRAFGFVALFQLVQLCQSHRPASTVWFKNANTRRLVRANLVVSI